MSKNKTWSEYKSDIKLEAEAVDAAQKELDARLRGYNLKELRQTCEITQMELSQEIKVSQAMISKVERGDLGSMQIATLQKYVEALGGSLRITAEVGNTAYILL